MLAWRLLCSVPLFLFRARQSLPAGVHGARCAVRVDVCPGRGCTSGLIDGAPPGCSTQRNGMLILVRARRPRIHSRPPIRWRRNEMNHQKGSSQRPAGSTQRNGMLLIAIAYQSSEGCPRNEMNAGASGNSDLPSGPHVGLAPLYSLTDRNVSRVSENCPPHHQQTRTHEYSRERATRRRQAQYYYSLQSISKWDPSQALRLAGRPTSINAGPSTRRDQTTRIINDQMQAKGPRVGDTTSLGMDRRFRQRGIHGST